MRPNRLILVVLTAAATLLAVTVGALQGSVGLEHLVLDAAPFLLVAGALVAGLFPGEDRIIARRLAARPRRLRPARRTWPACRERALTSLAQRGPRSLRGPPAPAAA